MSSRPMLRSTVVESGTVVAELVRVADTHWTRLRGLLGTSDLPPGNGLWIRPCRQVHMFGMRYAIDAVFLDHDDRVVGLTPDLAPWKISPLVKTAASVLELPAGTIRASRLEVGSRLRMAPHDSH